MLKQGFKPSIAAEIWILFRSYAAFILTSNYLNYRIKKLPKRSKA